MGGNDENLTGEIDQGEGSAAAATAAQARRDALAAVSSGDVDLQGIFAQADNEVGQTSGRVFGHLHLRAVLLALPHVGEKRADEIMAGLGVTGDTHVAHLGSSQRQYLQEAVARYTAST